MRVLQFWHDVLQMPEAITAENLMQYKGIPQREEYQHGDYRWRMVIVSRLQYMERRGLLRKAGEGVYEKTGMTIEEAQQPSAVVKPKSKPKADLKDTTRDIILRTLAENGGHRAKTASALGIDTSTLYRKLERYKAEGIEIAEAPDTPPPSISDETQALAVCMAQLASLDIPARRRVLIHLHSFCIDTTLRDT